MVGWILIHNGVDLDTQLEELHLSFGDRLCLYQDEDDFDVVAMLDYRHVDALARKALVAVPDWTTIVRR
jgi:hypothetical protein